MSDTATNGPGPTSEDFRLWRANLHERAPQIVREKVAEIRESIKPFNPLDVITNVAFKNLFADPETYKETTHKGLQAYVEYVSLLCLSDEYREGQTRFIPGDIIEKVDSAIQEIYRQTFWYHIFANKGDRTAVERSNLERLRLETITSQLLIRGEAYPHHLEEMLAKLFRLPTLPRSIPQHLGFSPQTALACINGMGNLIDQRLREKRDVGRATAKRLRAAVKAYKKSRVITTGFNEDILRYFAKTQTKKLKEAVRDFVGACFFDAIGDLWSFSLGHLAQAANCPEKEVHSFLEAFSIGFGELNVDGDFPAPTHPLQMTPIIRHPNGYFCVLPEMVLWALRPRIEELIRQDGKLWEKYQRARGQFLVDETLNLIQQGLDGSRVYGNLEYRRYVGSEEQVFELDGLVLFDKVALLVEGKAGGLTKAAREGKRLRLQDDLKKLVADPHEQALRARSFIDEVESPEFSLPNGKRLKFDKTSVDKFVLVTVTLDALDTFTASLHQVKEIGLFVEGDLPWAVSLLNLKVIIETLDFPSQFIHYLQRRLRLNDIAKIHAADETDYWGNYLAQGLYLDEFGIYDNLLLGSHTTDFDDYYAFQRGLRATVAEKPTQKLVPLFAQVIREVEESGGLGFVNVVTALLDMSSNSRNTFTNALTAQRKKASRDGKVHDFSLHFDEEGKSGITVFCSRDLPPAELRQRLQVFCMAKKYRLRASNWTGIASCTKYPGLVHGWVILNDTWKPHPELEKLTQTLLPDDVES